MRSTVYKKILHVCEKCRPIEWLEGKPVFPAYRINSRQYQFWCPVCGDWHIHGNVGGIREHRVAHCYHDDSPLHRGGYYFQEVGSITRELLKTHKPINWSWTSQYQAAWRAKYLEQVVRFLQPSRLEATSPV